jgi:hypothetical protein
MNQYKVSIILQIHNEVEKGNLERFFSHHQSLVDNIIVCDLASSDGSYEYANRFTPFVFRSGINDFEHELKYKSFMLEKSKSLGSNFVLFLDADEIISCDKKMINNMCKFLDIYGFDAGSFTQINLWRSNNYQRMDNNFGNAEFVRLWHIKRNTKFKDTKIGLHKKLYPSGIKKIYHFKFVPVLHYGFSDEKNIAFKYLNYKKFGQTGKLLNRLINEDTLELLEVPSCFFPVSLNISSPKPSKFNINESRAYIENFKNEFQIPDYSIICMIYASPNWAEFVFKQVHKYTDMRNSEFFFVANNANTDVINYLEKNLIPHVRFENSTPDDEWYINNVYRGWNYGAKYAKGKNLIFINSDMAFSPDWLVNLVKNHSNNAVSSRLVESGRLASGLYGVEKNFGYDVSSYNEKLFTLYAKKISKPTIRPSGLFMPLLISKSDFLSVGGYPEGNIVKTDSGYRIANVGESCISGDKFFIDRLSMLGINHITAFDSLVYHFQEGEMRTKSSGVTKDFTLAICNDVVGSSIGKERVLWDYLMESLGNTIAIDNPSFGLKISDPRYSSKAKKKVKKSNEFDLIIQNATYIEKISNKIFTISYLQDVHNKGSRIHQRQLEVLRNSQLLVTNSEFTAEQYPDFNFKVIPIGIDSEIFKPMDKNSLRTKHKFDLTKKIGIFVGSLSETKGWSEVQDIIETNLNIHFIVVSKYEAALKMENVTFFSNIDHSHLAELYNCADFFILGSRLETQCLAALEACACNIPLLIHDVGYFNKLTSEEKSDIGIITNLDLKDFINEITNTTYSPLNLFKKHDLTTEEMINKWKLLVSKNISNIHSFNHSIYSREKHLNKKTKNTRALIKDKIIEIYKYVLFEYPIILKILKRIIPERYLHKIQMRVRKND